MRRAQRTARAAAVDHASSFLLTPRHGQLLPIADLFLTPCSARASVSGPPARCSFSLLDVVGLVQGDHASCCPPTTLLLCLPLAPHADEVSMVPTPSRPARLERLPTDRPSRTSSVSLLAVRTPGKMENPRKSRSPLATTCGTADRLIRTADEPVGRDEGCDDPERSEPPTVDDWMHDAPDDHPRSWVASLVDWRRGR